MSLKLGSYLWQLRKNCKKYENIDINGKSNIGFFHKNGKKIICLSVSSLIVYFMDKGFSNDFVSYAATVLSILIGLFLTAIIFSFDKFYLKSDCEVNIYEVDINRGKNDEQDKHFRLAMKNVTQPSSRQILWEDQAYNYSKQFAYLTGYNIVLSIFAVLLLSLNPLFDFLKTTDIHDFHLSLTEINIYAIENFFLFLIILIQRIGVLYIIGNVMYNTLFIVSSMVAFMTAKIDRMN